MAMKQPNVLYASLILALIIGSSTGVYLSHHHLGSAWQDMRSSQSEADTLFKKIESQSLEISTRELAAADLYKTAQEIKSESLQAITESEAQKKHAMALQLNLTTQLSQTTQSKKRAELARSIAEDTNRSAERAAEKSRQLQIYYKNARAKALVAKKESQKVKSKHKTAHSKYVKEQARLENERSSLEKLRQTAQSQITAARQHRTEASQVINEVEQLKSEVSALESEVCSLQSELSLETEINDERSNTYATDNRNQTTYPQKRVQNRACPLQNPAQRNSGRPRDVLARNASLRR